MQDIPWSLQEPSVQVQVLGIVLGQDERYLGNTTPSVVLDSVMGHFGSQPNFG